MGLAKVAALSLVGRAERRLGVTLDYARAIARADFGLFRRYGRIFQFLDGNRHAPAEAYAAARLRGALAADCGTCVEAEIALARAAGLTPGRIDAILAGEGDHDRGVAAVIRLADSVTGRREDDPAAREEILAAYGETALIELAYAMNGAALLPGIKRAMGYATRCDIAVMRRLAQARV